MGGSVNYQFQLDNDPDFSSPLYSVIQRTPTRRPPGLLRGAYFWRVRAQDAASNWSEGRRRTLSISFHSGDEDLSVLRE
ncbi:MAG TPA: hypothetical protein VK249_09385 [Anaerolineales bacterium]|nr:hypothetical protein [Anaerolineales bacterium]